MASNRVLPEVFSMVRRHRHTVPALIAAFLLGLVAIVPAAANDTAQTLPFAQDWTDIDQITAADNWSGVLGIQGFQGQDPTTTGPVDPRTFLTATNDLDVIDDLTNPAITNGGVAEFELANPVVAIQGTGTTDAPYLLFHLDTTGAGNVRVAYNLRDVETGDDAVQPWRSSIGSAPAAASRMFQGHTSPTRRTAVPHRSSHM